MIIPTGKEYVTGSFDKNIIIFNTSEEYSRECYHDKRMQKVYSVMYSMDDKYVLSGSDDTNIRVLKAVDNDAIKILNKREEDSRNYNKKLIEKYQYMPEIKRIKNQKHLAKYIINKKKEFRIRKEAKKENSEIKKLIVSLAL